MAFLRRSYPLFRNSFLRPFRARAFSTKIPSTRNFSAESGSGPMNSSSSGIWRGFVTAPDTPAGFTLRTAFDTEKNPGGAETMLELWQAGSEEPPHSHPGDDMTVVVEGRMSIQFFVKDGSGKLVEDGERVYLNKGETGYIAGGRIHDAKYIEDCKLVYVHDKGFGFVDETH